MKVIRERILKAVHKCLQWENGEIAGIDMLKLEQRVDGILEQLNKPVVMQAEGSDGAKEAAVGNSAAGKGVIVEPCPNCKELTDECACLRNKCIRCGLPVGNITFTVCDDCWNKEHGA